MRKEILNEEPLTPSNKSPLQGHMFAAQKLVRHGFRNAPVQLLDEGNA